MITRIREVRRTRKMTLDDVARACSPPTTPQTIGRLETGTRTVSVGWLNRIAGALGVTAGDLVQLPDREDIAVAAVLGPDGVHAPRKAGVVVPPAATPGLVAIEVAGAVGDYRTGDELWCERINVADESSDGPAPLTRAMNRDILVPRPAGRFLFGRLIGTEGTKLHILPLGPAQRQLVVTNPPWIAVAVRLVRAL